MNLGYILKKGLQSSHNPAKYQMKIAFWGLEETT
jgi:hypothetical protein